MFISLFIGPDVYYLVIYSIQMFMSLLYTAFTGPDVYELVIYSIQMFMSLLYPAFIGPDVYELVISMLMMCLNAVVLNDSLIFSFFTLCYF